MVDTPPAEFDTNPSLVAALVGQQHPQFADELRLDPPHVLIEYSQVKVPHAPLTEGSEGQLTGTK